MKKSRFVPSKEITRLVTEPGRSKLYREIHMGRIEGAKSSSSGVGVLIPRPIFEAWLADPAHAKYLVAANTPQK